MSASRPMPIWPFIEKDMGLALRSMVTWLAATLKK
jgi:hypothetical protein